MQIVMIADGPIGKVHHDTKTDILISQCTLIWMLQFFHACMEDEFQGSIPDSAKTILLKY